MGPLDGYSYQTPPSSPIRKRIRLEGETPPFDNPMEDYKKALVEQQNPTGCGGACVYMLAKDKGIELKGHIWKHDELLTCERLLAMLERANVPAEERSYYTIDPSEMDDSPEFAIQVENGEEALKDISNYTPMIVGIAHPRLEGHWIIIDKVSGDQVFLRDPYSGMAYRESFQKIAGMLLNDVCKEAGIRIL